MATRQPHVNEQIMAEANAWLLDFEESEVERAGRQEFNDWLRRSPEHVQAFLQAASFWEEAGLLDKRAGLDLDSLIARALAEGNVVPMDLSAPEREPERRGRTSRFLGLAAAVVASAGIGGFLWYTEFRAPTYVTDIGELRSVTLEDGSSVDLNARSRLRVNFTERERSIELIEGQALFAVAKDPARPFVVSAGDARVRAVGTQFDVYRKRTGTVVTVVEGHIAVAPRSSSSAGSPVRLESGEVHLAQGERLTITPTAIGAPEPVNVAVAMAWTEKKLVFDDTPLDEVVEEFNRYNRQQLVIRDPDLRDYHVSGVFPSTDAARMVEFLRQRFGVTIESRGDAIEITRSRTDGDAAD